jgi:hypothetical protein
MRTAKGSNICKEPYHFHVTLNRPKFVYEQRSPVNGD